MRIGDYIIYPPVFFLAIAIPIILAIIIILLVNRRQDKKNKELNLITKWQKTRLIEILDDEIKATPNSSEEYHTTINKLQGYIRHNRYWDYEDLLDFDENSIILLTTILFEKIKADVEANKNNEAVLLCHALDFINCGVEYEGKYIEWIGDEISSDKNHDQMTDNEGRLFHICLSAVEKIMALIDPDLDKIPEINYDVDPVLKTYVGYDFEKAYEDLQEAIDFRNLQPETFDICARALVYELHMIIKDLEKMYLPYYQVYFLRALACCLDRQLYDKILTSIDY